MIHTPFALYKHFDGVSGYDFYREFECDLFGVYNWGINIENKKEWDDNICMFYGLYKGLYLYDVSAKEIYRCYLTNKLDELIHTTYSLQKSGYYKDFCEKNIKIGKTFIEYEGQDKYDINKPLIYKIIVPPYHTYIDKNPNYYNNLIDYSLKSLDKIIEHKIDSYKEQDKLKNRIIDNNYVNVDNVKQLLNKQDNKCYICCDKVITNCWCSGCLYQFTLDRINNTLSHNKNNVLISCLYCNCHSERNEYIGKLCPNNCHTIKRNDIKRTKTNVKIQEIKKLILK